MSQAGILNVIENNPTIPIFFEGNTGTGASALFNILNIVGSAGVTTNATGNTVTISLTGGSQAIDSLTTDVSGPVSPDVTGNVAVTGATNIFSDGSVANTLRLNLQGTNHALFIGRGTTTASAQLGVGTNGQVLIAATTADPAFATLTSSDSSITFTTGANTLSAQVAGGTTVGKTITGNSGGALSPTAGNWNILGTGSLTTVGSGSTLTPQLTGLTNHAVLVGAGTATITKLAVGTNGQVLIGSTSADPAFSTLTSSDSSVTFTTGAHTLSLQVANRVQTINGDSGSITGATVTIFANTATNNSGASVKFVNSGTTSTLGVSDALSNTFIGKNSGTTTVSGSENTSLGTTSLQSVTSGVFNTAIGSRSQNLMQNGVSNTSVGLASLSSNVSGSSNSAFGEECLTLNTSDFNSCFGSKSMNSSGAGSQNSCLGYGSGNAITSGSLNCIVGMQAGQNLLTGSTNVLIGYRAGNNYTSSESNNILLDNAGVIAESTVIRIGTVGTHSKAFVSGISGVTVAASVPVLIDANGQMGTVLSSRRFKENIKDIQSEKVLNLRPVTFDYISTKESCAGLIAEEVYEVLPNLVVLDKEGKPFTVRYEQLCVYLLSEVKKLSEKVHALEETTYQ